MQKVTTISALREVIGYWRQRNQTVALVATMGNLHDGHLKLVSEAKKKANRVVVSVFVNPTQFAPGEDFEAYPRTESKDEEKLQKAAVDLFFLPQCHEIYPQKISETTRVSVPGLSGLLCGDSRPGHFDGVATIVTKLFNIVQPDYAFFGEKDFQQLTLIRHLVRDLNIPVEILGVATQREADGLAMSSRNYFLTTEQRKIAAELYKSLCLARQAVLTAGKNLRLIEEEQKQHLQNLGFQVDYFLICRRQDLLLADEGAQELVVLTAAKLGKPRLIDNICFSRSTSQAESC